MNCDRPFRVRCRLGVARLACAALGRYLCCVSLRESRRLFSSFYAVVALCLGGLFASGRVRVQRARLRRCKYYIASLVPFLMCNVSVTVQALRLSVLSVPPWVPKVWIDAEPRNVQV